MLMRPNPYRSVRGFSLLEILVAFAVFGIVGTALLQLFQSGLDHIDRSHKMTQAVLLAQTKLAELRVLPDLQPGESEGVYPQGYRWYVQLEPYQPGLSDPNHRFRAFSVTLRIGWGERGVYQLQTLLLGSNPVSP